MSKPQRDRRGRLAAGVVAGLSSLLVFASMGGVGLAKDAINLVQYQYGKKVTVCHKNKNTIRISVNAWKAHQRHGDVQGTCAQVKAKKLKAAKIRAAKKAAHAAEAKQLKQLKSELKANQRAAKTQAKAAKQQAKAAERAAKQQGQSFSGPGNGNGNGNGKGAGGNGKGNGKK